MSQDFRRKTDAELMDTALAMEIERLSKLANDPRFRGEAKTAMLADVERLTELRLPYTNQRDTERAARQEEQNRDPCSR